MNKGESESDRIEMLPETFSQNRRNNNTDFEAAAAAHPFQIPNINVHIWNNNKANVKNGLMKAKHIARAFGTLVSMLVAWNRDSEWTKNDAQERKFSHIAKQTKNERRTEKRQPVKAIAGITSVSISTSTSNRSTQNTTNENNKRIYGQCKGEQIKRISVSYIGTNWRLRVIEWDGWRKQGNNNIGGSKFAKGRGGRVWA